MKRLRLILSAYTLAVCMASAWAEDVKTCLVVYGQDEAKVIYALDTKPVLTYDTDALVVTATDVEARHALADIVRMTFEDVDVANAIHEASAENRLVRATADGVSLHGFEAGAAVQVYAVGGQTVRTARVQRDGTLNLSLSDLPAGIYIVKANSTQLKIRRK